MDPFGPPDSGLPRGPVEVNADRPPGIDRLVLRMRDCLRARHYSRYTERAYVAWLLRFVLFHGNRRPDQLSALDVRSYLTHLAVVRNVGSSTQNQALSALLFFYAEVLQRKPVGLETLPRARYSRRVPAVLAREEIRRLLARAREPLRLMIALLYGSGLRLSECCRLRVGDLDFATQRITVHDGKGQKDRLTILPARLAAALQRHLERVREIHRVDLASGGGRAPTPETQRLVLGSTSREWRWQWLFPASRWRSVMPATAPVRPHVHESVLQKEFGIALRAAGIAKAASCHTLRHSFASDESKGLENPGAEELLATWGGTDAGLPFYVFVDAEGKKTADSKVMPNGRNVGFPNSTQEAEAFVGLLERTAIRMSSDQRRAVVEYLAKQVKK